MGLGAIGDGRVGDGGMGWLTASAFLAPAMPMTRIDQPSSQLGRMTDILTRVESSMRGTAAGKFRSFGMSVEESITNLHQR